ncbi:MAG: peptidase M15, partial [Nitrobacter sp.]
MMNPRRLPTVPTPLLVSVSLSVIFMTGIVGLLAASGPEGIQHTGAAPRTDTSAVSYSTELEFAGALADASIALNMRKPVVDAISINSQDVPPTKPAPVQVASANPSDFELGNANKAVTSIEIVDECFVVDICVDRYLWALYQRTPKEDTIKKREWRSVTVKRKV